MTALTRDDLNVIEGDARVSCQRLRDVMEVKNTQTLHRLIERNREELETYGIIISHAGYKLSVGRPEKSFLLNEEQALLICMFSRTKRAAEARRQIISVFTAWRQGDLQRLATEKQAPDIFESAALRTGHVVEQINHLDQMTDLALRVTHLPIWPSGRRPPWWRDIEVRTFLTTAHRQMS